MQLNNILNHQLEQWDLASPGRPLASLATGLLPSHPPACPGAPRAQAFALDAQANLLLAATGKAGVIYNVRLYTVISFNSVVRSVEDFCIVKL